MPTWQVRPSQSATLDAGPTLERLLAAASASGEIHQDVDAAEFLGAVANLCHGGAPAAPEGSGQAERMVRLLLAGLRTEDIV